MIPENGKGEEELAPLISPKLDEEIGNLQEFFISYRNTVIKIKMHWFPVFDNKLVDINSGLGNSFLAQIKIESNLTKSTSFFNSDSILV